MAPSSSPFLKFFVFRVVRVFFIARTVVLSELKSKIPRVGKVTRITNKGITFAE